MFEFIRERAPIGQRSIHVFILDDAAIAAALAAAESGAAAGGTAAAGGAVTAGGLGSGALGTGLTATELGSAAAPTAAEMGAEVAPSAYEGMRLNQAMAPLDAQHGGPQQGIDPMQSANNLSQGNLGAEAMAPVQKLGQMMPSINETSTNLSQGNVGAEIKNLDMGSRMPGNDMAPGAGDLASGLLGGSSEAPPMPAPQPLPEAPDKPMTPSTPGMPTSLQDRFKTAHSALRMASKLVTNKKDKQTLGLMSLSTALAGNGGDLSGSMQDLNGPLDDIAAGVEQPKRLDQALSPLSPSTQQQPPKAPINQNASPATARGTGFTPPTRLTADNFAMQPNQRMSRYY